MSRSQLAASYDESEGNSRKRFRRSSARDSDTTTHEQDRTDDSTSNKYDPKLFEYSVPKEYESAFATAVFELGLKSSSPKILMPLMHAGTSLSTEHIKSHLQKYRIHHQRSKEEFMAFYDTHMRDAFDAWERTRGWETATADSSSGPQREDSRHSLTAQGNFSRGHSAHSSSASLSSLPPPPAADRDPTPAAPSKADLLRHAEAMIQEWRALYQESLVNQERVGSVSE